MDTLQVFIRQSHIERGEPRRPNCCPVALALKEQLACNTALVCTEFAFVPGPDYDSIEYRLPESAQRWIEAFDHGEPVEPFDFVMERTAEHGVAEAANRIAEGMGMS